MSPIPKDTIDQFIDVHAESSACLPDAANQAFPIARNEVVKIVT